MINLLFILLTFRAVFCCSLAPEVGALKSSFQLNFEIGLFCFID